MDILAEQASHGALVLISTHSDHIARLCDRAISLDSTDNANEVLSASIHPTAGSRERVAQWTAVPLGSAVVVQDGGHDRSPGVEVEPDKRAAVCGHVMLPWWVQYTTSTQKDR